MEIQDEISILSPKIVEEAYQMALKVEENSWERNIPKEEVLSEEREVKVVEEDLQHQEMELVAAHLNMHTQKVMQMAEEIPTEEEEAEVEEEKWDVTDVTNWDIEPMNAQRKRMWVQFREMKLLLRLENKQQICLKQRNKLC